jgi:hypothetical protein
MAAIAADRGRLLSLLSLLNDLIDQVQLVAAFQAPPLAEHLVGSGYLDAEQRSGVEAMVALDLTRHCGDVEEILAPVSGEVTESEA